MPFIQYHHPITTAANGTEDDFLPPGTTKLYFPTQSYQIPIFLIPGILGNGNEMMHTLAEQFYTQSKGIRPIYVYYDNRFVDPLTPRAPLSLTEQVEMIVNQMTACLANGPIPYVIAGYSFGAALSVLVAKKLRENKQEVLVYAIDGASPKAITALYNDSLSLAPLPEIIHIANYAARLTSLTEICLNEEALARLNKKTLVSYFQEVETLILAANPKKPHTDQAEFRAIFKIAQQNIQQMIDETLTVNDPQKLEEIMLFVTAETEKKYPSPTLGFTEYAEHVQLMPDETLRDQPHNALMQASFASKLAQMIRSDIFKKIPPDKLKKWIIDYVEAAAQNEEMCETPMPKRSPLKLFDSNPVIPRESVAELSHCNTKPAI